MVVFFKKGSNHIIAVETNHKFSDAEKEKLTWLFDGAKPLASTSLKGKYVGPPWKSLKTWALKELLALRNFS